MKIAILGAGNIGGILGSKWLNVGHDVLFGVREASSPKAVSALNKAQGAQVMGVESAIRMGRRSCFRCRGKLSPRSRRRMQNI